MTVYNFHVFLLISTVLGPEWTTVNSNKNPYYVKMYAALRTHLSHDAKLIVTLLLPFTIPIPLVSAVQFLLLCISLYGFLEHACSLDIIVRHEWHLSRYCCSLQLRFMLLFLFFMLLYWNLLFKMWPLEPVNFIHFIFIFPA